MIEATCTACGNTQRIADGEVPAGSTFVLCTNCNSRIALPSMAADPAGLPASLRSDLMDLPAPKRTSALGIAEAPRPPSRPGGTAPQEAPRAPPPPAPASDDDSAAPGAVQIDFEASRAMTRPM